MHTYLNVHEVRSATEEQLKQGSSAPADEFGFTRKNILYNREQSLLHVRCNKQGCCRKFNQELGNKCDWISEVKTIAGLEKTGRHFSN
ncbi:MAG: hypothetical protein M3258_02095 [Thermoproteota archaeon]|nr:hypothetical protein [Thermoproteota archaeon]